MRIPHLVLMSAFLIDCGGGPGSDAAHPTDGPADAAGPDGPPTDALLGEAPAADGPVAPDTPPPVDAPPIDAPPGSLVTIDPAKRLQTITGWEATAFAGQTDPAFPLFKDRMFDLAIDDLGLNRVRLEIRSGVENSRDYWTEYTNGTIDYATWRANRYATVNDNADPAVVNAAGFQWASFDDSVDKVVEPLRQRMQAKGRKLFVNLCYVAFTGQITTGSYHHADAAEYGELVLATYDHLKTKYGWTPDTWEMILEPDNTTQWTGTVIGNALVAAAGRLGAAAYTPRFVAPSNTNMANAITWFDQMIQVPKVLDHLEELSYHRYGGVSDANLAAIASRSAMHKVKTSHLEWIGATYQELHKDLALAGNSAWSQFTLGGPGPDNGGGYYHVDVTNPAAPVVAIGSRTKFLRQYFRYVREGAVRVGAATGDASLDPLAFINANGGHTVVVKTGAAASFSIGGLPAATYGIRFTTAAQYDIGLPDATITPGQFVAASIPAAGVITIFAR